MKKRVLMLLMVLALAGSVVGCGLEQGGSSSSHSDRDKDDDDKEDDDDEDDDKDDDKDDNKDDNKDDDKDEEKDNDGGNHSGGASIDDTDEAMAAFEEKYAPIYDLPADKYTPYEEWPDEDLWEEAGLPNLDFSDKDVEVKISRAELSSTRAVNVTFSGTDANLMDDIFDEVLDRAEGEYGSLGEDIEVEDQEVAGIITKTPHYYINEDFVIGGIHTTVYVMRQSYQDDSGLMDGMESVIFQIQTTYSYYK